MNHRVTIPANANRLAVIKAFIVFLNNLPQDQAFDVTVTKFKKKRTNKQNSSFHKYFSLLAETLNNAGLDMRKVLKADIAIPWTEKSVKEQMWRKIQIAMYEKQSTTDLVTHEVTKVYETLNKHLGEKLGIHVPFPNRED